MRLNTLLVLVLLGVIIISGCIGTSTPTQTTEKGDEEMAKKALIVIAPENFRDEEFLEPKSVLEAAGVEITVASKGVETAKGALGATAKVDKDISEVNAADYDAVIFVGGTGASTYFNDAQALKIATDAIGLNKVVGAICIAPSILANTGILQGKRATAFSSEEANLKAKGLTYTGEEVTQDGNIITGNGPDASTKFAQTIANELK